MTKTLDFVPGTHDLQGERARFASILRRHAEAVGSVRHKLRDTLVAYLTTSPQSDRLIDLVINYCVDLRSEDRLDIAIDILSEIGELIHNYAYRFLVDDIRKWHHMYAPKAYEPNGEYWFIMLRSVARADVPEENKLAFIAMCSKANSRVVLEGVLEALGDMESDAAIPRIRQFLDHSDGFISRLANSLINNGL